MKQSRPLFVLVPLLAWGLPAGLASAQGVPGDDRKTLVTQTASLMQGRLEGVVTDEGGHPLAGVAVSAQSNDLNFAMTDTTGRFRFGSLHPGTYWIRAKLSGYSSSSRGVALVRPANATTHSIRLKRLPSADSAPQVLQAGIGVAAEPAPTIAGTEGEGALGEPTDHGALAWRLRHLKRLVLRDENIGVLDDRPSRSFFDPGVLVDVVESSARVAANFLTDVPFRGQVRLLTTSAFDSPAELFSLSSASRSVAYFSLQSPSGDWAVQGAMTPGDVSSWIVAGTYQIEPVDAHDVHLAMSYGTQRYDGGNPAALAAVSDGRRNAGTVAAVDNWTPSKAFTVSYGAQYARYDYLDRSNLFSPSLSIGISPARATWIRAEARQEMLAPGAEEFAPTPMAAVWGPPERTFSGIGPTSELRPERTRHVAVGVDREIGSFVVGVRRFEQRVDDQHVTMFGLPPAEGAPRTDLGHYYIAAGGALSVDGWSVEVSRPVGSRVRGSVTYTVSDAMFTTLQDMPLSPTRALARRRTEQLHDVTGHVETHVTETRTRVVVIYKVNTGFARTTAEGVSGGLDGRFDVQLHQGLPVPALGQSRWELVLAMRNLFHPQGHGASLYDELLVTNPPKRVMGGLSVKF